MGAGVLLIEHYTARHAISRTILRSGIAVILFREHKTGKFSDAGGASDPNESPECCASRELTEESAGLFWLNLEDPVVSKTCVRLTSGYTSFIIPVRHQNGIKKRLYTQNLEELYRRAGAAGLPHCLKETDDMRRFFIDDLIKHGVLLSTSRRKAADVATPPSSAPQKMFVAPDVYSVPCILSKRVVCVLQKAFSLGFLSRRFHWNYLHCNRNIGLHSQNATAVDHEPTEAHHTKCSSSSSSSSSSSGSISVFPSNTATCLQHCYMFATRVQPRLARPDDPYYRRHFYAGPAGPESRAMTGVAAPPQLFRGSDSGQQSPVECSGVIQGSEGDTITEANEA